MWLRPFRPADTQNRGCTVNFPLNNKSELKDYQTNGSSTLTSAYLRGADGLISEADYTGPVPITSYRLENLNHLLQ
jgi:hypothetical protein